MIKCTQVEVLKICVQRTTIHQKEGLGVQQSLQRMVELSSTKFKNYIIHASCIVCIAQPNGDEPLRKC